MTVTHRSLILAALIGAAFLSCAGDGAREDNQAPPPAQAGFTVIRPDGSPPPPVMVWRHGDPVQAQLAVPPMRMRGAPGRFVVRDPSALDHQDGPRLGVSVESSNDGLRVTEITETSIAGSAGIKAGDVLLRIGDEHINTVGDVRHALHGKKPGEQVKVAVIRAGEGIVELTGTVPEPPADAKADEAHEQGLYTADGSRGGFLGVRLKAAEGEEDNQPKQQDGADAGAAGGAPQSGAQGGSQGGVVVEDVVPNSAAWFAGLEAEDCLLSIDGQALASNADLVGAVASKEPGTFVELKYRRGSEEHTAKARLGQKPMAGMFQTMQMRGPQGLGGQQLQDLLDLHGGSGQWRFDVPDESEMSLLLDGLQQPGSMRSIRVEIDGDRMTVERDGQTEHYMRGPDGNWETEGGLSSNDGSRA